MVVEGLFKGLVITKAAKEAFITRGLAILTEMASRHVTPQFRRTLKFVWAILAEVPILLAVKLQMGLELGFGQKSLGTEMTIMDQVVIDDDFVKDEVKASLKNWLRFVTGFWRFWSEAAHSGFFIVRDNGIHN